MIKSYLLNSSVKYAKLNVKHENNSYIFEYPCVNYYECTYYVFEMQPGIYKFELYGASGGSGSGMFHHIDLPMEAVFHKTELSV